MSATDSREQTCPAKVARVLDDYAVVINRGERHGVKLGQRILIYRLDDEPLLDPDNGDELGHLEIVCGTGEVSHVQESVATVRSTKRGPGVQRSVKRQSPWAIMSPELETITEIGEVEPFVHPQVGDLAKPI